MSRMSSLYIGNLEHRRFLPKPHKFNYSVFYFYIDLDEVTSIFRFPFLLSLNFPGICSFWRKDYYGDHLKDLKTEIHNLIQDRTGERIEGPVRLLTNISYFGFCFNPVSFYYCFDSDKTTLKYIVAEVTNTPWKERHQHVLKFKSESKEIYELAKDFHVSPFMPMNIDYKWVFHKPHEEAFVYMQNRYSGEKDLLFDSTLRLKKLSLTFRNLVWVLMRFPLITVKTMAAIYYQAARLYFKRTPFHTHPSKT